MEEKCGNCKFFIPFRNLKSNGDCIRRAPVRLDKNSSSFPSTPEFMYCGEFFQKEDFPEENIHIKIIRKNRGCDGGI
tara:strand:+ start:1594 stop:1824 length:231 start_codon:yes stop_codon:yes gene_type:complete